MGVDTHYNPRVLLEEKDFPQGSFRLLDDQVNKKMSMSRYISTKCRGCLSVLLLYKVHH